MASCGYHVLAWKSFQPAQKNLMSRIDYSSSVFEFPPHKITCPSGRLRTEFTSPTAKISFLFHFLCTLISTVPLKSKLTLEARNSRLDPRISKLDCFEFWDARIESRDARIESRVSLIEVNRYFHFRRFLLHVQCMYPLLPMFRDFHRWTVPLGNSFCELSLSRIWRM